MNWKERFLPRNVVEVGCLSFFIVVAFVAAAYFLGYLNYIPYLAMALWVIFFVLRFGFQAQVVYQVPKRTAFIVSGGIVFVYFIIWLSICMLVVFGFSDFIRQTYLWLFVISGIALAIVFYFHLVRFKQTVYEKWLGWQIKERADD